MFSGTIDPSTLTFHGTGTDFTFGPLCFKFPATGQISKDRKTLVIRFRHYTAFGPDPGTCPDPYGQKREHSLMLVRMP